MSESEVGKFGSLGGWWCNIFRLAHFTVISSYYQKGCSRAQCAPQGLRRKKIKFLQEELSFKHQCNNGSDAFEQQDDGDDKVRNCAIDNSLRIVLDDVRYTAEEPHTLLSKTFIDGTLSVLQQGD